MFIAALGAAAAGAWIDPPVWRALVAAAAAGAGVCTAWLVGRQAPGADEQAKANTPDPGGSGSNLTLEQLDAVGKIAQIGIWELDLKAKTVVWSDEVCRIHEVPLGHTPRLEEAISYYEPEARQDIADLVERSIAEGVHYDEEFTIVAANGTRKRVRAIGLPLMEGGQCVKLWGAFQDITELHGARERLVDMSERFVYAIESAADGPWDYVPQTGVVWYSEQFKKLLGLPPEESESFPPTLESFLRRLHPSDQESTKRAFRDHLEHDAPYEVRHRIRMASGEYRWFRARARSQRNEDGKAVRMAGSITDIHKQHTTESWLGLASRAARIGLWDWEFNAELVACDDTFYSILGYEPGEIDLSTQGWPSLCHPEDRSRQREALRRCRKVGVDRYECEYRILSKSGAWVWVRELGEVVERTPTGTPRRMTGACMDIDASKRLNMALQSITELNVNGRIDETMTAISRSIAEMYGATIVGVSRVSTDDTGQGVGDLIGGWHGSQPAAPLRYCLDGTPCGQAIAEDYCFFSDGVVAVFPSAEPLKMVGARAYHGLRLRNRDDEIIGVLFMLHDRPMQSDPSIESTLRLFGARLAAELERSDTEAAIRSAMDQARRANEAKSEFLANMSHEIRTPMTAILGYAGLLEEEALAEGGSERARDAAVVLRSNAEHLLALINDTLDVSKIEAGQMTAEQIPTNPGALINETVQEIREQAVARGLELRVRGVDSLPTLIRTDPTRLRQILANLIGNAVKFTEHGFVEIHAFCEPGDSALRIEIQDTGVGMTPEQLERVLRFEAFTQADYSTTRRFGGTGLGLKISSELAGMLGGGISATSTSGEGSTFTLTVSTGDTALLDELSPKEDTMKARASTASSPTLSGIRVLLAEDSIDNQRLIQFHLERRGAEVKPVQNGSEAVRAALENGGAFDVVLMDMQMPGLDGYGASRQIREQGLGVPIIALTAHTLSGEEQKCLDAGCSAYQPKPIDWDRLMTTARALVDANRETGEGSAAA